MFVLSYENFIIEKKKRTGKEKQIVFQITNHTPGTVDYRLIEFIKDNWELFYYKSPYGHSYYSHEVDWGHKPNNSYRLSDHWNFISNNKTHCETTTNVNNNTHWSIGKYNSEIGKYEIIVSYPFNHTKENLIKRKEIKSELMDKYAKYMSDRKKDSIEKYTFISKSIPEMDFYLNGEKVKLIKWGPNKIRYEINGEKMSLKDRELYRQEYKGYLNNKLILDKPKRDDFKIII